MSTWAEGREGREGREGSGSGRWVEDDRRHVGGVRDGEREERVQIVGSWEERGNTYQRDSIDGQPAAERRRMQSDGGGEGRGSAAGQSFRERARTSAS